MERYQGRVATITGASRGIGLDIAERLVAEGTWVCIAARNETTLDDATEARGGPEQPSLVSVFIEELFAAEGAGMAVNYGVNRLPFPIPVPVNSRVCGRGELVDVQTAPEWAQSTVRLTFETEGSDKPGCVSNALIRCLLDQKGR